MAATLSVPGRSVGTSFVNEIVLGGLRNHNPTVTDAGGDHGHVVVHEVVVPVARPTRGAPGDAAVRRHPGGRRHGQRVQRVETEVVRVTQAFVMASDRTC